jgi:hypothetical protein
MGVVSAKGTAICMHCRAKEDHPVPGFQHRRAMRVSLPLLPIYACSERRSNASITKLPWWKQSRRHHDPASRLAYASLARHNPIGLFAYGHRE